MYLTAWRTFLPSRALSAPSPPFNAGKGGYSQFISLNLQKIWQSMNLQVLLSRSRTFSHYAFTRLLLVAVGSAMTASLMAQTLKRNQNYIDYIAQYKDLAIEEMLRYKIPASITLAQGLLESGAGSSDLARKGNNHFGIKCHGWSGRTMTHDDDLNGECFRAYDNVKQSFEDHSKFLKRDRYQKLFQLKITDYEGWARGLKECGYATNPKYAQTLISIINTYELYQYDRARSFDRFVATHTGTDRPVRKGATLHPIYRFNDNYYLKARPGDNLDLIAQEVGISARKLAKYNERPRAGELSEGEIVYLKKKQKKAPKQYSQPHVVRKGESFYSIAQMYGIRLKSLYKMNGLSPDHTLRVGQRLRVR